MTDESEAGESTAELVASLHDHLAATAELPVETTASRWLGEAEAVAADLRHADVDEETVVRRVGHVDDLLSHVDGTGDDAANEHVASAREVVAAILEDD